MSRKRQVTQPFYNSNSAFQQASFILQSMCSQKRNFEDEAEGGAFLDCVNEISQFASYEVKQAFVLVLYLCVEFMKAEPDPNSLAADNLHRFELHFRASCSPLFNQLTSFLPEGYGESKAAEVDKNSELRNMR